mmetsp:Transcript_82/g.155  ORF Transcript_82/g.155 Transcript_82/m.155 type:complete len:83 (+) Transcript_82:1037-1285(+)
MIGIEVLEMARGLKPGEGKVEERREKWRKIFDSGKALGVDGAGRSCTRETGGQACLDQRDCPRSSEGAAQTRTARYLQGNDS